MNLDRKEKHDIAIACATLQIEFNKDEYIVVAKDENDERVKKSKENKRNLLIADFIDCYTDTITKLTK